MTAIQPGQTYRSVGDGFRIRIVEVGVTSVRATDVANRRPLLNRIPIRQLHVTATTRDGKPRRNGYALEAGQ
ncbi:hypothetical protein ACODT3_10645 [Streptomyces sp. 4.24]|uniref:hypothetical protein n=1 Tax=Streptomyces tritrimontium TaxID=3406573 RepID=UPI003BB6C6A2